MISICCTYYRSLTLANLAAALYSVRRQTLSSVAEIVLLDNNTDDAPEAIARVVDDLAFPVPVRVLSCKHGDRTKTHAWSTNAAVAHAREPWILFTRADYLLAFDAIDRFIEAPPSSDLTFIVSGYFDVRADIGTCERTEWRREGPEVLRSMGRAYAHTPIDAGVWFTSRQAFDLVDGLDESLTAWGHAQTHFQHKLYRAGVACLCLPEILFYHPDHAYEVPRDLALARAQLQQIGVSLGELWARYDGPEHPYPTEVR